MDTRATRGIKVLFAFLLALLFFHNFHDISSYPIDDSTGNLRAIKVPTDLHDNGSNNNNNNNNNNPAPSNMLILGLAGSLDEISPNVVTSLKSYCESYASATTVSILFGGGEDLIGNSVESDLQGSCTTVHFLSDKLLVPKNQQKQLTVQQQERLHTVNRYERLAKLRSAHRNYYNAESGGGISYDAVVNVDMDVLQLPDWGVVSKAVDRVTKDDGYNLVCANGYENWWSFLPVYYDTFASIDKNGDWLYGTMADAFGVVTGAGSRFYKEVLSEGDGVTVMTTCFGGLGVYRGGKTYVRAKPGEERSDEPFEHPVGGNHTGLRTPRKGPPHGSTNICSVFGDVTIFGVLAK